MALQKFDDLLRIAFDLNDAVLNQNGWQNALQNFADAFGGSFATFEVISKKTGAHLQHQDSSDIEIQTKYLDHFMPINPRIAFGTRPDAPNILHDAQFMSEKEMNHSEFYEDFLRPHDLRYFLACKAYETSDYSCVFTIQKGKNSTQPSDEDLQALNQLAPSLSRTAHSQLEFAQLFTRRRDLESVFEGTEDGVLLLDTSGTVRKLNSAADRIVQRGDGVTISAGKVVCRDATNNAKLAEMIFQISDKNLFDAREKTLFVNRAANSPPYQIRIQKCARHSNGLLESPDTLLMFIRDPGQGLELDMLNLIDGFGLTPTEASVAILITKGQTADEISTSMKVTLPTIRTHIQRILRKMGIKRQLEIAIILSRVNAGVKFHHSPE